VVEGVISEATDEGRFILLIISRRWPYLLPLVILRSLDICLTGSKAATHLTHIHVLVVDVESIISVELIDYGLLVEHHVLRPSWQTISSIRCSTLFIYIRISCTLLSDYARVSSRWHLRSVLRKLLLVHHLLILHRFQLIFLKILANVIHLEEVLCYVGNLRILSSNWKTHRWHTQLRCLGRKLHILLRILRICVTEHF